MPCLIVHSGNLGKSAGTATERLASFRHCARQERIRILAYCVTKDLQAVVIPKTEDSIARVFESMGAGGREACRTIDRTRVFDMIRWVECAPVRLGLVSHADQYDWSSAAAHAWSVDMRQMLDMQWFWTEAKGRNWREFLQHGAASELLSLPATA